MNTQEIKAFAAKCRIDLLHMIQTAGSGHPGGSLSTVDLLIALYDAFPYDRILVSHGHTAAALYAVLGNFGYFDIKEALDHFRRGTSPFEGHPNAHLPGVTWCSGALGQGLSVAAGFAAGERLRDSSRHVWVVMGDGEQSKGQVHEARAFCAKYNTSNLTVIIDNNRLQASGSCEDILNTYLPETFRAMHWNVEKVDGHDFTALKAKLSVCRTAGKPTVLIADTVMGKGVSEIENDYRFHGALLSEEVYLKALKKLMETAAGAPVFPFRETAETFLPPVTALPEFREYSVPTDARSAFGETLCAIAQVNPERTAAVDCDLAASVKLEKYGKNFPERFFECGIAEEHAVSFAAGLSRIEPDTFFADFGVFGMTEVLSQLRMADFNDTSLKVICTHCGSDVGEDGKTHQAVDYLALARTLPSFRLLIPADANQCEHLVRYAATEPGNMILAMGRSKLPVIADENGKLFFGTDYRFRYGKADLIRSSAEDRGAIVTYGNFAPAAVALADKLKREHGIALRILNVSTPLEIDAEAMRFAAETGNVAVWEDHRNIGGLGMALGSWFFEHDIPCRFRIFGLTRNGISATPAEQLRYQKISSEDVEQYFIQNRKAESC